MLENNHYHCQSSISMIIIISSSINKNKSKKSNKNHHHHHHHHNQHYLTISKSYLLGVVSHQNLICWYNQCIQSVKVLKVHVPTVWNIRIFNAFLQCSIFNSCWRQSCNGMSWLSCDRSLGDCGTSTSYSFTLWCLYTDFWLLLTFDFFWLLTFLAFDFFFDFWLFFWLLTSFFTTNLQVILSVYWSIQMVFHCL